MRIAHVIDSMEVGGAERVVSLLCREQRKRGHDPSVHCLYRVGPLGDELRADGIEVVLHNPHSALGLIRSLSHHFRTSRPDVVHCHNANATIIAAVPARFAGAKKVVSTRHGLVEPPYALRRELKYAVASRFCDSIVAVCQTAAGNLRGAPCAARNKVECVWNGTSELPDVFRPEVKSGFTLLNVGRLSQAKDQATLLRAFAAARQNANDLRLWIVGDGPLREPLEQLATELNIDADVRFYGEQSELERFYRAADLLVMSSVTEGLPIALLEAMSVGLPAVVTEVGGMPEVVRMSGAGLIVPPSSAPDLAFAMECLARNPVQLSAMRQSARKCYLENFEATRMVGDYFRVYEEKGTEAVLCRPELDANR